MRLLNRPKDSKGFALTSTGASSLGFNRGPQGVQRSSIHFSLSCVLKYQNISFMWNSGQRRKGTRAKDAKELDLSLLPESVVMHDGITIVLLPSLMTTVPRPELCSLRLVVLLLTQTAVFRSHLLQFI